MRARYALAASLLSPVLAAIASPIRAEVALDPTFGTDGVVRTGFGVGHADTPYGMVILPDGRILVAGISDNGSQESYVAMARYSDSGALDTGTFGTGGIVMFRDDFRDQAKGIALQSDGKIVAVGSRWDSNFGSAQIPSIYRFQPDGAIDADFGTNGCTAGRYDGVSSGEHAGVTVRADGRLVAAGRCNANANGGVSGFGTKRYLDDGTQQASVRRDRNISFIEGGCAFPEDGGVLWVNYEFVNGRAEYVLARVDSVGDPDPSFGPSGVRGTGIEAIQGRPMRLALLPDGKFLLAGTTPRGSVLFEQMTVFRFNSDGTVDGTFGTGGRVDLDFQSFQDRCGDVAVDPQGNIVVVGTSSFGTQQGSLARLLPDGAPDEGFAPGGKFSTSLGTAAASLNRVVALAGGVILVAGVDGSSGGGDFMVARFAAPTVAVGDGARRAATSVRVAPNPSRSVSRVSLSLAAGAYVRVAVMDVAGRRVRELFMGALPAGTRVLEWDGRDDGGRAVASGAYEVRCEAGGEVVTGRVVRVR